MALQRANEIIGKSRDVYQCNHVVNYALNGDKNKGGLASDYKSYGEEVKVSRLHSAYNISIITFYFSKTPQALDVVVGNDGKHCGIFVDGDNFIHSSSKKHEVIKVGRAQLPYVFPGGYTIRRK